jgi:hypothetical protein
MVSYPININERYMNMNDREEKNRYKMKERVDAAFYEQNIRDSTREVMSTLTAFCGPKK